MDDIIDTELGFTHFRSLLILSRHGRPLSVNKLSDQLHLSLAATGRAVDKLVNLGLVFRREDAHDRRIKRVSLSGEGENAVALSFRRRQELVRDVIVKLPDALRSNLNNALVPILAGDYLGASTCAKESSQATTLDTELLTAHT